MSEPLEHDYIGLADSSSMERSSESSNFSTETEKNNAFNLKATELRLGLPGFTKDIEEDDSKIVSTKNFFPGGKRGFSDVDADDCRNWGFNGGCDADSNKVSSSSALFSSKNVKNTGLEINQPAILSSVMNQIEEKKKAPFTTENGSAPPIAKAQMVGWPPIRSFRKNTMATNLPKNDGVAENLGTGGCLYVKVSMDGAPYLRKVDLKTHRNYADLSKALERLFTCFTLGKCASNGLREGLSESNLKELLHGSECVLTYEDKDGDWMLVGDVPWEMFIDSCKRLRIMKGSEATGLVPIPMSSGRT
ncbi:unnamed protein product [Lactuca virosa]|uniref:Auxin-responsive protein n=1 Tax=Lactuca virosa TaxID=75947 RepID=A0AAU9NXJ4_9ASTR|nr:unnamed protein product [Lactuca virosa]